MLCVLDCKNEADDMTYSFLDDDRIIEIPLCEKHWDEYANGEDKFIDKYEDYFLDYVALEYAPRKMTKDAIYLNKVDEHMEDGR